MIHNILVVLVYVAVCYFSFGIGVSLTRLHDHYSRNQMGGPPLIYYLIAVVHPFAILADMRRAGRIRRGE